MTTTYCPRCLGAPHYTIGWDCTPHPAAIIWDEEKSSYENQIHQINEDRERLRKENKRFRVALLWIRKQLSCTLVPRNVWVKKLHGQIFMVCQTELEPE